MEYDGGVWKNCYKRRAGVRICMQYLNISVQCRITGSIMVGNGWKAFLDITGHDERI